MSPESGIRGPEIGGPWIPDRNSGVQESLTIGNNIMIPERL